MHPAYVYVVLPQQAADVTNDTRLVIIIHEEQTPLRDYFNREAVDPDYPRVFFAEEGPGHQEFFFRRL